MSSIIRLKSSQTPVKIIVSDTEGSFRNEEEIDPFKKQLEENYSKGYADGQLKIRRELEKDFTDKMVKKYEEVYNILVKYDEKIEEFESAFEKLVIDTAVEIAKKVVKREIDAENIIDQNLRNALNKIIGANEVKIKLHPDDLQQLNESSRNIISSGSFSKIKFEGDPGIEKGGCYVETEIGSVDARISTQINEIKKVLDESITNKDK